jgi:hypothetical protein
VLITIFIGSHAEAVCTSLCKHLMVVKLSDPLSEATAEFTILAAAMMTSLLEDTSYFHPPSFNCFLFILAYLKGE